MLTSATRGETLTPNPNECHSTLTSAIRELIYPYPLIYIYCLGIEYDFKYSPSQTEKSNWEPRSQGGSEWPGCSIIINFTHLWKAGCCFQRPPHIFFIWAISFFCLVKFKMTGQYITKLIKRRLKYWPVKNKRALWLFHLWIGGLLAA